MTKDDYLAAEGRPRRSSTRTSRSAPGRRSTAQFVLDEIAEKEQLSVDEEELSEHLVRQAPRYGMAPDQFAQEIVAGRPGAGARRRGRPRQGAGPGAREGRRSRDASGRDVDLEALREDAAAEEMSEIAEVEDDEPVDGEVSHEGHDHD